MLTHLPLASARVNRSHVPKRFQPLVARAMQNKKAGATGIEPETQPSNVRSLAIRAGLLSCTECTRNYIY
jgi:hypothetical protein